MPILHCKTPLRGILGMFQQKGLKIRTISVRKEQILLSEGYGKG
jgi:hypothetical protein